MNLIDKSVIAAAIACLPLIAGCQKGDGDFLKRNTQSLKFSYMASSETFTVRASGDWYISDAPGTTQWTDTYGWVSVDKLSGTGDGASYEKITVTCAQNIEAERTATIYLHGPGQQDVPISITQENGVFEFTSFSNGAGIALSGILKKGEASEASLAIPYIKALGNEVYDVTVTMEEGGEGLRVASGEYRINASGSGSLEIPVEGTPSSQGTVRFSVKAKDAMDTSAGEIDFGEVQTIVRAGFDSEGNVIALVDQNFNKMPWGGDCIANVKGVVPVDATVATLAIDAATKECAVGDNGLGSGVTSTLRSSNPALFSALGLAGWTGYTNYMRPGYIQLGQASTNTIGQPGSLVSPEFNIPEGCSAMQLTLKVAVWCDHPDAIEVGICDKHDGVYSNINQGNYQDRYINKVKYRTYASIEDIKYNTWAEYSFVLPCAGLSSPKSIYAVIPQSWWNEDGTIPLGRVYVDDIKLVY